jgi:excinuclease ABC subunit C
LEAYILEQGLIKKLQPKYNVDGKDDKSFCYLVVTKEEFPKFVVMRKTDLEEIKNQKSKIKISNQKAKVTGKIPDIKYQMHDSRIYGPFTSRKNIELALKIIRKIFPYHSKTQKTERGCLDSQIGLCPAPYDGAISKEDYAKNIRGIKMILEGKKKRLIDNMKKEMEEYSSGEDFEKAAEVRNKIFALQHIQDVALIVGRDEAVPRLYGAMQNAMRVEGYDISNISGKYAVGSMAVFDNSDGELQPNKSQYRKFKIKTIEGTNDVGAMEEVLSRRFGNNWTRPDLIILDGGAGHLNMARKVLRNYKIEIPLLAVAKGPDRKKMDIRSFGSVPEIPKNVIEQVRDEAHRFAITYHRKTRRKSLLL